MRSDTHPYPAKRTRPTEGGAALFGLIAAAGCQVHAALPAELAVTSERLPNGLNVIYHQDHRVPLVTLNIWYYVGSKDEVRGRSGFAHLFEHLMFMGTQRVPAGKFDGTIEGAGGSNNASTSNDRTNYYDEGPAHLLPTLLYLEADRMEAFGKAIDQEKLDTQRRVVQNERRQSYENRPYGKAVLEKWKLLFPPGHPYHEPVIGSHEDLESAGVQDVKDFFARFYVPANACLVVAGDFDLPRTQELVRKYFGKIPAGTPAERMRPIAVTLDKEKRTVIPDRVQLERVSFLYHSPAAFQPGDADLDLAADILGEGKSSRLYRSLVYERKVAQDVAAVQQSLLLGSVFEIQATARPGQSLDDLERALDEEVAKFLEAPPTAAELERARSGYEVGFWRRQEHLGARADQLNYYQFYFGTPAGIGRDLGRYYEATLDSVHQAARKTFRRDARLVVRVVSDRNAAPPAAPPGTASAAPAGPGKEPAAPGPAKAAPPVPPAGAGAATASDKVASAKSASEKAGTPPPVKEGAAVVTAPSPSPARAVEPPSDLLPPQPPEPDAPKAFVPPVPQVSKLSNGMELWVIPVETVPLVNLTLILRGAGATADPTGREGLAALTASMLDEGAGDLGAIEMSDLLDLLGASLIAAAGRERAELRLSVLKRNLDRALDLFGDVLQRPRLEEKEWERVKTLTVNELMQRRDNPAAVARVVSDRTFFGDRHAYAAPISGYADTVRALTLDDVRGFYKERWGAGGAVLIAAGDISADELIPKLEARLSGWRKGEPAAAAGQAPAPRLGSGPRPRLIIVEKPAAPQTVISIAMPGVARTDPKYPDLALANIIFGGSFTSRLNQNLREKNEFTYGAGSNFHRYRGPGAFFVQTAVKTDVTGQALAEIARECRGMRSGLAPGELDKAKAAARVNMVESFSTVAGSAETLTTAADLGLPPDEPRRLQQRLEALSPQEVETAARDLIRWDQATVTLVGDPKALQAEIAEANELLKSIDPEAAAFPAPVIADADGKTQ